MGCIHLLRYMWIIWVIIPSYQLMLCLSNEHHLYKILLFKTSPVYRAPGNLILYNTRGQTADMVYWQHWYCAGYQLPCLTARSSPLFSKPITFFLRKHSRLFESFTIICRILFGVFFVKQKKCI
jgi:hypothetical protein